MKEIILTRFSRKIIPLTVAIAFFMSALDGFVLNVAIPTMAASLHQPPLILKLAVTTYLLSMGIFIPVSGWLADRYGTRNIFLTAMILFGLGSLGCGISQTLLQLILSRLVQGIGGAMLMPVGRLALNRIYPKEEIFKLMAMVAMMGLLGPAMGPIVGGVIITYFSWHWIFFVNLPFVIAGIILVAKFMPNILGEELRPFSWMGFILFGLGIAGVGFGFSSIGQNALPVAIELGFLLSGIIFFLLYYIQHGKTKYPFVDTRIFNIASYRIAMIGGFNLRLGTSSLSFLVALMCQLAFNLTPMETGFILLPYPLGLFCSKPFIKTIVSAFGLRNILFYNTIAVSFLMIFLAFLDPNKNIFEILIVLFLFGLLLSLEYSALQTLNLVNSTQVLLGQMISLANVMQQITASLAVALSALCLQFFFHFSGKMYGASGFHGVFIVNAMIVLISSRNFLKLKPTDGEEFTGYRVKKESS